jgi:glucosamine--fructose-6-phosphate aminotransferase (isomerizing)
MCGIVGYVGSRAATPIILEGLKRLEYRGYDSSGIAVIDRGRIEIRRAVGKLAELACLLDRKPLAGNIGIGHTRWATHGKPSERNAHPHLDCAGDIVVIHNGIVENCTDLRLELSAAGHKFESETDTETIPHLIEEYKRLGASLEHASRLALQRLKGANAIVVMSRHEPGKIIAARIGNAGGVVIGLGRDENLIASDMPAILEHTQRMVFLHSREMAIVTAKEVRYLRLETGEEVEKEAVAVPWDPVAAAKGEYRHFMQKEIFEQAQSLTDTIRGRVDFERGHVLLADEVGLTEREIRQLDRVVTIACGTSAYAGRVGKYLIEHLARLPVEVDYGSEFRYRDPILNERTLVLAISQSGETVDTLAALETAQSRGGRLVSIVNVIGSQAALSSDGVIYMHVGPEIGVASTKAFTASIVDQYLLALYLGQVRGTLDPVRAKDLVRDLARLPGLASEVLGREAEYDALAVQFSDRTDFLYLGRGINYPIALEGALKLKEISYIHAEGYPAGEMKHGPIALIDERMPVVAIAMRDNVFDKMISQIEQVKARGGIVIAVAVEQDDFVRSRADHVIPVPEAPPLLTPVLTVLPLQLFAYHMAVQLGTDVDQPRNLAKSVTVE